MSTTYLRCAEERRLRELRLTLGGAGSAAKAAKVPKEVYEAAAEGIDYALTPGQADKLRKFLHENE